MKSWLSFMAIALLLSWFPCAVGAQDPAQQSSAADDRETDTDARSVRRFGDVIGSGSSDFSMDIPEIQAPAQPIADQPEVALPDPAMDARLQNILASRAFEPDNPELAQALSTLLDEVEAQAGRALAAGDLELATRLVEVIDAFDDERDIVARVAAERERRAEVDQLLSEAAAALESGSLLEPRDASARALYERVLEIDADNEAAGEGLEAVGEAVLAAADALLVGGNLEDAEILLQDAEALDIESREIEARRERIAAALEDRQRSLVGQTREAIDEGDFDRAETRLNELIGMGAEGALVAELRAQLEDAERYGGWSRGRCSRKNCQASTPPAR